MLYKQLPNIKIYNKNGEKIDPFGEGEGNSSSLQNDYVQSSDLANVAFTGSYNDLTDKPTQSEIVNISNINGIIRGNSLDNNSQLDIDLLETDELYKVIPVVVNVDFSQYLQISPYSVKIGSAGGMGNLIDGELQIRTRDVPIQNGVYLLYYITTYLNIRRYALYDLDYFNIKHRTYIRKGNNNTSIAILPYDIKLNSKNDYNCLIYFDNDFIKGQHMINGTFIDDFVEYNIIGDYVYYQNVNIIDFNNIIPKGWHTFKSYKNLSNAYVYNYIDRINNH